MNAITTTRPVTAAAASVIWSELCRRLVSRLLRPVFARAAKDDAPSSYRLRVCRLVDAADCFPCVVSYAFEGPSRGMWVELSHEYEANQALWDL